MAYVELNPIRAKMAEAPETSDFTSIKQRINAHNKTALEIEKGATEHDKSSLSLKEFLLESDYLRDQIPYHYREYLELIDWTGRAIRADKRGVIDDRPPPILARLGIEAEYWHTIMQPKGAHQFSRAVGCCNKLREYARKLNIKWIKGISISAKLFPT